MLTAPAFRRISGSLFLLADIVLLLSNYHSLNYLYLIAAILFISCAIALYLSANNHRWLFYNAVAVILGYALVSFTDSGSGALSQYIGGIVGIIGGFLILRAAFQREYNKQYSFPKPFDLIDKYPMAGAGAIEGMSATLIFVGSLMNQNTVLTLVAFIWMVAHTCLFLSDEYLRARLKM